MKQIIFIDNDLQKGAEDDKMDLRFDLHYNDGIPKEFLNDIMVYHSFNFMPDEEKRRLLFDPNNVIATRSQYTYNHYNSEGQFFEFMIAVGKLNLTDRVYVDGSGHVDRPLSSLPNFEDKEEAKLIVKAVNNNYILTKDRDIEAKYRRVKVELSEEKMYDQDVTDVIVKFTYEEINLKELLGITE